LIAARVIATSIAVFISTRNTSDPGKTLALQR
jgi:hypothetical protein